MKAFRPVAVAAVIAVSVLISASADAQSSRDLANAQLMEGKEHLDAGEYAAAASSFESVVLDMDDPDNEFLDLRAIAGVFLCLARAKNQQIDAARAACQNVIAMRNAPQSVKDQATELLNKLN